MLDNRFYNPWEFASLKFLLINIIYNRQVYITYVLALAQTVSHPMERFYFFVFTYSLKFLQIFSTLKLTFFYFFVIEQPPVNGHLS